MVVLGRNSQDVAEASDLSEWASSSNAGVSSPGDGSVFSIFSFKDTVEDIAMPESRKLLSIEGGVDPAMLERRFKASCCSSISRIFKRSYIACEFGSHFSRKEFAKPSRLVSFFEA